MELSTTSILHPSLPPPSLNLFLSPFDHPPFLPLLLPYPPSPHPPPPLTSLIPSLNYSPLSPPHSLILLHCMCSYLSSLSSPSFLPSPSSSPPSPSYLHRVSLPTLFPLPAPSYLHGVVLPLNVFLSYKFTLTGSALSSWVSLSKNQNDTSVQSFLNWANCQGRP